MLWTVCIISFVIIMALLARILLMRKAAREIGQDLAYSLAHETNNLITVSTRDKSMCRLAEQINHELRLLRSQRRRFQQGDLEMREAITNISHDLRTPLTAICGYLALLEEEEKTQAAERYLEIIKERTESMRALTEELFGYTVVNGPPPGEESQEICLGSLLEESISAFYAVLTGCGITPCISIPEESVMGRCNKKALSRVFENILSNAVKYSDGDLRITLTRTGDIFFENHASGLDEVQVSRLFNRFYTVETARPSTGLGLSIARSLMEQMHGGIDAFYRDSVLSIHVSLPPGDLAFLSGLQPVEKQAEYEG